MPTLRRNGLVNQVEFLHIFATVLPSNVQIYQICSKEIRMDTCVEIKVLLLLGNCYIITDLTISLVPLFITR